jgi:polysaccharide export outer membrane protein
MDQKLRFLFGIGLLTLSLSSGASASYAAEVSKTPPKDLVQYIRDASRLGLKEADIEQNALKAGWPAATVKDAIAYARSSSAAVSDPAPNTARPASPPPVESTPATAAATPASAAAVPETRDTPARPALPDEYRIGAGDVLQVSVWKEPEASVGATVVRPDGKIGLPLLKEVEVVGMTPSEAEKAITAKLGRLIPGADVTVVVSAIHSKKIYMVGAVKKEGPIPYTYRMTVMQALSEAGGLNDYAKRKKIYILRAQNGKDYKLPFDYEAVLRGERMELNIPLLPSDTVVVPH